MPTSGIPANHRGDAQESNGDAQSLWEMPKFGTSQRCHYFPGLAPSKLLRWSTTSMQLRLKPRAWWRVPAQVFGEMTGKMLGCSYSTEETDPEDRRELGSRHECRSVTDKPVTIPLGKGKILQKKTQKRQGFFCRLAKGAREKA